MTFHGILQTALAAAKPPTEVLFPLADYWWVYGLFTLFVFTVLVVDLGVLHRKPREMRLREAIGWCITWPTLALLFNLGFWYYAGWKLPLVEAEAPGFLERCGYPGAVEAAATLAANTVALQFLAGYVVEQSLSVDNIFVFVVIFSFFAVPLKYQHRVLFYGIVGAVVFRAIFIALGAVLLRYHWVVIVFGVFLLLTGVKLLLASDKPKDLSKNWLLRLLRRILPVTPTYHDDHFIVRIDKRLFATPLLVALIVVEATDIVFAVDSVPAIFGLTREPLIVFTSNVFAILGLRALYFLLAGAMDLFHLLKYGLGLVLMFVGLKMVWLDHLMGGKFPISWSLGIICGLIGGAMVLSLVVGRRAKSVPNPILGPAGSSAPSE